MSFEEHLHSLCSPDSPSQTLPGVVLLANDTTGKRVYAQAIGTTSVDPALSRPLTPNSIFWVASCTKLIAGIAALQVVERGLISLDDDIGTICPELASPDIIHGLDNASNKVVLGKATQPIRFRHLLTHTSGMANHFLSPLVTKWWEEKGENADDYKGDILKIYDAPLVAEPGTEWNYSPGLDWAGLIVARLTGEPGLGAYADKHIFQPLGIKDTAFRQRDLGLGADDLAARWVCMTRRAREMNGKLVPDGPLYPLNPKDEWGGGALYTSPAEYIKVLTSLLANDGKLLKPSTVEELVFQPELVPGKVGTLAHGSLLHVLATSRARAMFTGGLPTPDSSENDGDEEIEYQYGLLGLLNRQRGEARWTLSWSGLPNLFWWVNPAQGLCGMYASQILPPGDPSSLRLAASWRAEMEARFGTAA